MITRRPASCTGASAGPGKARLECAAICPRSGSRVYRALRPALSQSSRSEVASPKASEIVLLLIKYTDLKDRAIYERMTPFAVDPDGKINLATLRNDLEFYKSRQLVGPNMSVEAVVDMSFAEEAAKELGPYERAR